MMTKIESLCPAKYLCDDDVQYGGIHDRVAATVVRL